MGSGNLVAALMYGDKTVLDKCKEELVKEFGAAVKESEEYDFEHTNYYEKEFGTGLKKRFIVFEKRIDKKELADV